MYHQCRKFNKI